MILAVPVFGLPIDVYLFNPLLCSGIKGGGFSPDFCENTILRYELAMMARTCTNNLRVVLSP